MGWRLELIGSDDCGPPERLTVCELGEIAAPVDLDGVSFDLSSSQRVLCETLRRDRRTGRANPLPGIRRGLLHHRLGVAVAGGDLG